MIVQDTVLDNDVGPCPGTELVVADGVQLDNQSNGTSFIAANSVTSNRAQDTGLPAGGFDLADRNPGCAGMSWAGNTFVTRNQPCIN